ncbi:MAG TPA: MFS transporter [Anaerolineae bacterium]
MGVAKDDVMETRPAGVRGLPRNVWAVSATSFFMDISSEMVINLLPLFLANVLGVHTSTIGVIEGGAEWAASIFKLFSGWFSDKIGDRKWLAVLGYAISALAKPFFYMAHSWEMVAAARWGDRVGKGVRTAPRDALVADSIRPEQRGLAFGFHRAADTAGAMLGLVIALLVVWLVQRTDPNLAEHTFRTIVLISLLPAFLAVLALALGAENVKVKGQRAAPKFAFRALGKPFMTFMLIVSVFTLGNSSDAFLTLRANRIDNGLSIMGVLGMLITFNLIYVLISTPAGALSDRIGRRRLIVGGWLAYALIYLGFGLARSGWQIWVLYALYGVYYGMAYGTASALIADLVPAEVRGTAYGTYNAIISVMALLSSIIAGILWQGIGTWPGLGPSAPFLFGGGLALLATLLMQLWMPTLAPAAAK